MANEIYTFWAQEKVEANPTTVYSHNLLHIWNFRFNFSQMWILHFIISLILFYLQQFGCINKRKELVNCRGKTNTFLLHIYTLNSCFFFFFIIFNSIKHLKLSMKDLYLKKTPCILIEIIQSYEEQRNIEWKRC